MNTSSERFRKRVLKVLTEQNFHLGEREHDLISRRVSNGKRYFYMVAKRNEKGQIVDRFIKIPESNSKKILEPFTRQILCADYLKKHASLRTRGIIDYNVDPKKGIPFAIMETFSLAHARVGFIEGTTGSELLGPTEAKHIIRDLDTFHTINFNSLPKKLKSLIKPKGRGSGYDYIVQSVEDALKMRVSPLDIGENKKESLHKTLERRLQVSHFKQRISEVLNKLKPYVEDKKNTGTFLVHGDMAPNNLYIYDNGEVEFLDLEWVSVFRNKVVAMVYDFGNLRARAWKNKIFRDSLDNELVALYREKGEEDLGKIIVCLSILRSNIRFSKYFENYPWDKQKKEEETERRMVTEKEIKKIWDYSF